MDLNEDGLHLKHGELKTDSIPFLVILLLHVKYIIGLTKLTNFSLLSIPFPLPPTKLRIFKKTFGSTPNLFFNTES